jgi:hypothetical protein
VILRRWFLRLPQERRPLVVIGLTVLTWLLLGALFVALYVVFTHLF